ncbi:EAL domain-containing protein (putative c-di-GMP-specific phosphodiesterase class I) [Haloactinospora alba]|uniref:EAL domain-containing protein (Putative c-di-GMP-specific phosphodiesterase class I) n=1 Tax=Haloactinospora alba TaxID=405555 RepID=A0A543NHU0_9ACTN|nr:EAL domain-containing protein [Haloactinospora alba]TQN31405.1 EAL domain-containing protein (putative c-di-GMP-specific phosphodiesterase class I) [Haloactinospora alba]
MCAQYRARAAGPPSLEGAPGGGPLSDGALLFRPIVDLDSGAVLAAAIEEPRDVPESSPDALVSHFSWLARRASAEEALLPLVLPLAVPAAEDPGVLRVLEHELRRAGRRPRDVTLMLGTNLSSVDRDSLRQLVERVRELGFRCAFGTVSVPPDLLVETAPFLFAIDAGIVASLPAEERYVGVVEGVTRIGRGSGIFPMACGVSTHAQLTAVRSAGIRLAHGPLFADDAWRPGDRIRPVPGDPPAAAGRGEKDELRVSAFIAPLVSMDSEVTAEEVLDVFTQDTALNSVVLTDHRERPVAVLDRSRFLLAVTGPYGHALHAKRPARRLADAPRTVRRDFPVWEALRIAGAEREQVHDDVVVVNEFGQCTGIIHVGDLIRALSRG